MVLDDFFQNLDPEYRLRLVALLTDRRRPWTVVAVSHDPAFLAACDRVVVMDGGRVRRVGAYAELAEELAPLVQPTRVAPPARGAAAGRARGGANGTHDAEAHDA